MRIPPCTRTTLLSSASRPNSRLVVAGEVPVSSDPSWTLSWFLVLRDWRTAILRWSSLLILRSTVLYGYHVGRYIVNDSIDCLIKLSKPIIDSTIKPRNTGVIPRKSGWNYDGFDHVRVEKRQTVCQSERCPSEGMRSRPIDSRVQKEGDRH